MRSRRRCSKHKALNRCSCGVPCPWREKAKQTFLSSPTDVSWVNLARVVPGGLLPDRNEAPQCFLCSDRCPTFFIGRTSCLPTLVVLPFKKGGQLRHEYRIDYPCHANHVQICSKRALPESTPKGSTFPGGCWKKRRPMIAWLPPVW